MGRKSAHTGESPKDRSINIMDKFITRNMNREKHQPFKSGIRKDPYIPIHQWPLKDQIEYWENRTDEDRFDDKYPIYSYWDYKAEFEIRNLFPKNQLNLSRKWLMKIMRECGIHVVESPAVIGKTMAKVLGKVTA